MFVLRVVEVGGGWRANVAAQRGKRYAHDIDPICKPNQFAIFGVIHTGHSPVVIP